MCVEPATGYVDSRAPGVHAVKYACMQVQISIVENYPTFCLDNDLIYMARMKPIYFLSD